MIKEIWTDRNLTVFMDICESLKCGQSCCDELTGYNKFVFIKAFFPEFNPCTDTGEIVKHMNHNNGFPVFRVWIALNTKSSLTTA